MSHASLEVQGSMMSLCLSPCVFASSLAFCSKNINKHFTENICICNLIYVLGCWCMLVWTVLRCLMGNSSMIYFDILLKIDWVHQPRHFHSLLFTVPKLQCMKVSPICHQPLVKVGNQNGSHGYFYPNPITGQNLSVACSSRKTNCTLVSSTNISMTWSNRKNIKNKVSLFLLPKP